jgi:hypothetical protein
MVFTGCNAKLAIVHACREAVAAHIQLANRGGPWRTMRFPIHHHSIHSFAIGKASNQFRVTA